MSRRTRLALAFGCALLAGVLTVGGISALGGALWTADGVAVSTSTATCNSPDVAPDGAHGAIIAWHENRSGDNDIYAQRVDPDGAAIWPAGGVTVCAGLNGQQYPEVAADESGGATIVWEDQRSVSNDIYAQKVGSDGTMAWATDGVTVCGYLGGQFDARVASDGADGAIVTWADARTGYYDIYAQRVYSSGAVAWTVDGLGVCTTSGSQNRPQIVSDGAEGLIVAWQDPRDDGSTGTDIYAQRVYSNGTPAWTVNGLAVCTAADDQQDPQIVSDGMGGAIVAWRDERDIGTSGNDIYAQRVDAEGTLLWTTDGVSLCTALNDQLYPELATDGAGGAIVEWEDKREAGEVDIYAGRVLSDGTPAWITDGVSLCDELRYQTDSRIVSDGVGGAIVTWHDQRVDDNYDVYAQRVDGEGNVLWQDDGLAVSTVSGYQWYPEIVGDGYGGAIVTWEDRRTLTAAGRPDLTLATGGYVFAQRVGTVGAKLPLVVKNG